MRLGDAARDLADAPLEQVAHLGAKLRMVPRSVASCGITLSASPAWIWVIETTACVHRVDVARHDRLQRHDDLGARRRSGRGRDAASRRGRPVPVSRI